MDALRRQWTELERFIAVRMMLMLLIYLLLLFRDVTVLLELV